MTMTNQETRELFETFETDPTSKEAFFFMSNFHYYWHDQDLFISKLKALDIDVKSARSYYSKLKKNIEQNPEFVRCWCHYLRYHFFGSRTSLAPGSILYNEIKELQLLITSIIKNNGNK